jgi:hypothetical protein
MPTNSRNYAAGVIVSSTWLNDADRHIFDDMINIMNYGADNTGVALCNTALDEAKAAGRGGLGSTVYFPPGVYRIENYSLDDLRIVGARCSGGNVGANEQTVIEGSGDIFVNCTAFGLEHLVIRNSSAGSRGKLLTIADADTKIGPIIDVDFRKATYHIYGGNANFAIVSGQINNCRFSDASVYSRYYLHNLFAYDEYNCYTTSNKRGLYITSCSTAHIHGSATVFEYNDEYAIVIENTTIATDVIRSLHLDGIHFEHNGNVTPGAEVYVNVTLSLARMKISGCIFALPTVAASAVVDLNLSPSVYLIHDNCTDIGVTGLASTSRITSIAPKVSGQTLGLYCQNGSIFTTMQSIAGDGFHSQSQLSATIDNSGADNIVACPSVGTGRLVWIYDSTTEGHALVALTPTAHVVISNGLTSITLSVAGGFLKGLVTGGATSRVLFYTYLST